MRQPFRTRGADAMMERPALIRIRMRFMRVPRRAAAHIVLFAMIVLAAASPSAAAPVQSKEQVWQGVLDVGVAKLRLQFRIAKDGDDFSGEMVSRDQGNARVPLSAVIIDGDTVKLELAAAGAKFTGRRTGSGKVVGKWTQGGREWDLTLEQVDRVMPDQHIESWQGTLQAGGREFEFQVRVFRDPGGKLLAKLDSFSENLIGLPIEMTRHEDAFHFEVRLTKATYEGSYNKDKSRVTGHWLQSGGKFPLDFTSIDISKTRQPQPRKRPQHPQPPYPYVSEEVRFENQAADVSLAGTLTYPTGDGPFPAAILITGSGPEDRDETIFEHKPFLVIADDLTRRGIAVLRYDERGVGESTGKFAEATSEDFASDVSAAVDFLKTRTSIDGRRIGLIGHSEGGLIAPLVAVSRSDVAFIVMLAGPGVTGEQIGITQSRAMAAAEGAPKQIIDAQEQLLKTLFTAMKKHDGQLPDTVRQEALAEFRKALPPEQTEGVDIAALAEAGLQRIENPWFRFFLTYDPAVALRKLKCPVLALNGSTDLQVDAEANLNAIREALAAGGNPDFQVRTLSNLNHMFQTSETGKLSEYIELEETFAPVALNAMGEWIVKRMLPERGPKE